MSTLGLGDMLETALATIGIVGEDVERWIGRPCNCEERKQKLNQLGAWAKRVVSGKIEKAREYLLDILKP